MERVVMRLLTTRSHETGWEGSIIHSLATMADTVTTNIGMTCLARHRVDSFGQLRLYTKWMPIQSMT